MKIIIAGAGQVGSHLAKLLSQENHDIMLIDIDKDRLQAVSEKLEILTYAGSSISKKTLTDVEVGKCDLYIAVTPEESTNILSCMLASELGAVKTLARVDKDEYQQGVNQVFFTKQGVDSMIYPEKTAALEIVAALRNPWTRSYWELLDGSIILAGCKIRNNAPICGKTLEEISKKRKLFHVVAIKRNNKTIIPFGKDKILHNDLVYYATLKEHFLQLNEPMGKETYYVKNVMIMGGSRIGEWVARLLGNDVNVKVIEINQARAEKLSEDIGQKATILVGDGLDNELLVEEGIEETDAFIAVTGNTEANILSCLAAKNHGVKKTIAEIENLDFISIAQSLDIGTIINKKHIAASKIYELLLKADVSNFKCLTFADANVGEIIAQPGSKVTKKKVSDLNLPTDFTLGALVRGGKPILIDGETQIKEWDKVVVFFLNKSLKQIEKLFH
ncbi:MAG: Trk system potassium transporter TrkA [Bacteroidales bacterium]|jgi:trk system potassium uptake protein TrkA